MTQKLKGGKEKRRRRRRRQRKGRRRSLLRSCPGSQFINHASRRVRVRGRAKPKADSYKSEYPSVGLYENRPYQRALLLFAYEKKRRQRRTTPPPPSPAIQICSNSSEVGPICSYESAVQYQYHVLAECTRRL